MQHRNATAIMTIAALVTTLLGVMLLVDPAQGDAGPGKDPATCA